MKNVSSVKASSKCESPKTPGGISKALLTPCRRVGLSRNWKKSGPSPFISPLAADNSPKTSGTTPVSTAKQLSKRKKRILEEADENEEDEGSVKNDSGIADQEVITENLTDIVSTPTRTNSVQPPRRKKSKKVTVINEPDNVAESIVENPKVASNSLDKENTEDFATESMPETKSACVTPKTTQKVDEPVEKKETLGDTNETSKPMRKKSSIKVVKEKSPNNLAKECIVVLQKNILGKNEESVATSKTLTVTSQNLFDSDNDDVPLSSMKNVTEPKPKDNPLLVDDDDFVEAKTVKVKKLETKKPSKTKNKEPEAKNTKTQKNKPQEVTKPVSQSSNSFDDDDDFEFDCKRTILIRKSYDKVSKPTKFKTTGSITQKDIDEIKARIQVKKNLLLTKVLTKDTEELRGLIKKWRKGCQDALTELIELMRMKFPDRQNMDFSEILQTLRIPAALVGYDSDNDCFVSPDDVSIVLSKFQ